MSRSLYLNTTLGVHQEVYTCATTGTESVIAQARASERQTPGARNSVIYAIVEFRSEELPEDVRACVAKRGHPPRAPYPSW